VIFLLLGQLRREHADYAAFRWERRLLYAVLFLPVATIAVAACASREPFSITEGISIWPSEFLRLTGALLALYYLNKAGRLIRDNSREITTSFDLTDVQKPSEATSSFCRDCWCLLTQDWLPKSQPLDVAALWQRYQACDTPSRRWRRVAALSVFYLIFGGALMFGLGPLPGVPYRGLGALRFDRIALTCALVLFVLLTFYVLDATVLCERFVRQAIRKLAAESAVVWPEAESG